MQTHAFVKPKIRELAFRWRDYQSTLKKKDALRRIPFYAAGFVTFILLGYGLVALLMSPTSPAGHDLAMQTPGEGAEPGLKTGLKTMIDEAIDKPALRKIFNQLPFATACEKTFTVTAGNTSYMVQSSIDPRLQEFIIDHIDRKNSKHFGFVAMEPDTGRIVSMVSYDRNNPDANICITPEFPAASLFKIITAAAAIEKCGFNCHTPVTFNDNKYTLYKAQLKDRVNKYTHQISFEELFADSVNPVFGKIGQNRLGKSILESYATAFGFNTRFDFAIPLSPSTITIKDDAYNWAEIASGFNRHTLISPLHGALVIAGILNNGKLMEPTLIDAIRKDDQVIYHRNAQEVSNIIDPATADTLKKLMNATIISGTASKSFARSNKDKVLSRLNIGGKTGSINNNAEHLKYDWFAGFAEEKNGENKLVVTVLVVHQDFIGIRAASYSRMAIKEYFENDYASLDEGPSSKSAAL